MDRTRNVLNMLMMNFWCLLIVPVVWAVGGFSLAQVPFDNDLIGGFDAVFLRGFGILGEDGGAGLITIAFLGLFAVITPALLSGAVADRRSEERRVGNASGSTCRSGWSPYHATTNTNDYSVTESV